MGIAYKIINALCKRNPDPKLPENQNEDFQSGFNIGLHKPNGPDFEYITFEWEERGRPERHVNFDEWRKFEEWKIGYWSGSFTRIEQKIGDDNKK